MFGCNYGNCYVPFPQPSVEQCQLFRTSKVEQLAKTRGKKGAFCGHRINLHSDQPDNAWNEFTSHPAKCRETHRKKAHMIKWSQVNFLREQLWHCENILQENTPASGDSDVLLVVSWLVDGEWCPRRWVVSHSRRLTSQSAEPEQK